MGMNRDFPFQGKSAGAEPGSQAIFCSDFGNKVSKEMTKQNLPDEASAASSVIWQTAVQRWQLLWLRNQCHCHPFMFARCHG